MSFRAFVLAATGGRRRGRAPYPYQERLAAEGLPALLRVPTGAGKTLSAVLPWLWRLMLCPEETVRARSRRRLLTFPGSIDDVSNVGIPAVWGTRG
ncbi:hypothetical protein B4N89_45230 [Embleya scabrispora]|uniref:Uncharacterized protein n=1 Tax=Embleya scabrispora TaxID=159449 RepID=A0A1T3NIZ4_9ACTN|nr:hypothetical protein B4N89_45230 [Embleya scabrispora]